MVDFQLDPGSPVGESLVAGSMASSIMFGLGIGRANFAPKDIFAQLKTRLSRSLGAHLRTYMMMSINRI